jgi:hypothetical protein
MGFISQEPCLSVIQDKFLSLESIEGLLFNYRLITPAYTPAILTGPAWWLGG